MSVQTEINQKKLILSTTQVSKLLLSKGRRKINELSATPSNKALNNIDLSDLKSQINLKLSKEAENQTITTIADQSMFRPFGDKSIFLKQRSSLNPLDKSGFYNYKENNFFLSKLDKSQLGTGMEGVEQNQDTKGKKKLLRLDSTEAGFDKINIKISYIKNNYFPYENETNNLESSAKLKNFLVVFYFKIEKSTFVLIRKLDKKLDPLYFWNREEDAKKFGLNYSHITTPGLYFKNFENFKEAFYQRGENKQTAEKMWQILKEKKKEYEENIEKMKNEYELKIKELNETNEILNSKIVENENNINLKDIKIKDLSKKINSINEEINELQLINEKLSKENKKLKNILKKENININDKNDLNKNKGKNNKLKTFQRAKSQIDIKVNKNYKLKSANNSSNKKKSSFIMNYENHISENQYEKDINSSSNKDSDNSFPKLEEYNIEIDEEEKINKIKNIGTIKIYGERKKLFERYNTYINNQNNFLLSNEDNSIKEQKVNSSKNEYQNENLDSNKIMNENESFYDNKYDLKDDESSND